MATSISLLYPLLDLNRSSAVTSLFVPGKQFFTLFVFLYVASVAVGQTVVHVRPDNAVALTRLRDGTTVRFAAGTYFFPRPVVLPPHLNGVTLEAERGKSVILSAGQEITGWKLAMLNGHACWSADLPGVRVGILNFRELWVNGSRATRARFPATGYLASVEPADGKVPWDQGQTWFGYKPGDLPDDLPTDAEAIVFNRWNESRLPIESIDAVKHRVNCSRKSIFQLQDGDLYYLEGGSNWLQHPGDWYLDAHAGTLYYMPRPGEMRDKVQAIVPTHDRILEIRGASGLTLRGLTFSHSEWNLPDPVPGEPPATGGFAQAASGVSAAVKMEGCRDCTIDSCRFEHLGNFALELGRGCQHDLVDHCIFTDMGAGAIKIGEPDQRRSLVDQTFSNSVIDCRIIDGGHLFASACGIWIGQSYDNAIEHNEIADLFQAGISLGWTWGYGDSLCRGNHVTANLIHHIGKKSNGEGPVLSDMGAIYTLGARPGTVISGNICHDITGLVYGGWGIYLDEGSCGVLIENNLIYRTTDGGFHLHYGRDNVATNNIFAFGSKLQIARTQIDPGMNLTFKHNIVAWNSGAFTSTDPSAADFDQNLYVCTDRGKMTFGDKTLDAWKAAGQDRQTVVANPGFADPSHGDFTVRDASILKRIGFIPLQIGDAGPR